MELFGHNNINLFGCLCINCSLGLLVHIFGNKFHIFILALLYIFGTFIGHLYFGRSSKQAMLQEKRGLPAPECPHPSPGGATVYQVTPSGNLRARLVTPPANAVGVPRTDRYTDRFGTCSFADE
jgi:hypothetical protein